VKAAFNVGDLVRWKERVGIVSETNAEPSFMRGTFFELKGWYVITWMIPWHHLPASRPITESTLHREFLKLVARG
jgi:hypothetical protein